MRSKTLAISAIIITLIIILPMAASGQGKSDYVVIKGGIYSPTDNLDDLGFGTGFGGEIAYGHHFAPWVALECALGYFESDGSGSGTNGLYGAFTENNDIYAIPVTFSVNIFYPVGPFEFYAKGGVGLYFGRYKTDVNSATLGRTGFTDNAYAWGFNGGIGGNYNITESLFVGLEGIFIGTGQLNFNGTPGGTSTS
ncbi:porin family protein, partial [bacterium]|nr:porin family protein [bacterium]